MARLYLIHHVRQSDIAPQLGISQAGVSRLLKLAEDTGIVRTIVLPPEGMFPDLEDGLARKYGLARVTVVEKAITRTTSRGRLEPKLPTR